MKIYDTYESKSSQNNIGKQKSANTAIENVSPAISLIPLIDYRTISITVLTYIIFTNTTTNFNFQPLEPRPTTSQETSEVSIPIESGATID